VLHQVVENPRAGKRVVLVHGFTQTLRSWDTVAAALAAGREVVRVDLPGHGGSSDLRLSFAGTAAAIGDAGSVPERSGGSVPERSGGSVPERNADSVAAAYVGYSLGGRLCLRLALDRPEVVEALVLVGASPGLEDAADRAARRRADEDLAAQVEIDGTPAFVARWLQQPIFAGLQPSPADRSARDANPPEGLAAALRLLGTGAQEPLWDRLGELTMPVLLVAGERDAKFAAIADRMAAAIGRSEVVRIAGAGHAAHLERPHEWTAAVTAFLDSHQAS